MNKEQCESASVIMSLCRIFSEQMYKCLRNAGLLKDGYSIKVQVGQFADGYPDDRILTSSIELEKDIIKDHDEWEKTRFYQMKFSGEEWKIYADPIAKIGTVPKGIDVSERIRTISEGMGENPGKPYPVDGMWVGSADNDPVLDGGQ